MTEQSHSAPRDLAIARRTARPLALAFAGLTLLLLASESAGLHVTFGEMLMLTALVTMWLGLVVGLRFELLGGLLTLGGFVTFYVLDWRLSGDLPRGPYFLLLASPAPLYLYCAWRSRIATGGRAYGRSSSMKPASIQ